MNYDFYRLIPERKTVYAVQRGCCYEKVVFESETGDIGVGYGIDREGELTGPLECDVCDPNQEIQIITQAVYEAYRENVNKRRATC